MSMTPYVASTFRVGLTSDVGDTQGRFIWCRINDDARNTQGKLPLVLDRQVMTMTPKLELPLVSNGWVISMTRKVALLLVLDQLALSMTPNGAIFSIG